VSIVWQYLRDITEHHGDI